MVSSVLNRMQQDTTLWNNLLHMSGGKLALHKWLLLYHHLAMASRSRISSPTIQYLTTHHTTKPQQYTNTDTTHQQQKTHRTFRQMKTPTGNQTAQIKFLSKPIPPLTLGYSRSITHLRRSLSCVQNHMVS